VTDQLGGGPGRVNRFGAVGIASALSFPEVRFMKPTWWEAVWFMGTLG
jgi:hypothetical protein